MNHDDRLDDDAIRALLGTGDAGFPRRIETLACIDSTSAELLRRVPEAAEGVALLADAQSAGRGRQGRTWHSPPGANLYLSCARRLARGGGNLGGLSLAAGMACAAALRGLGFDEVGLKWPNDLLARKRKLGGILTELSGDLVVFGVGVNVRMPPVATGIDQAWIDLASLGDPPPRNAIAAAILRELGEMLQTFEREGFAAFAPRWERYDAIAGRPVRVMAGATELLGHALGVAADGALRIEIGGAERRFHSADVSLRPA